MRMPKLRSASTFYQCDNQRTQDLVELGIGLTSNSQFPALKVMIGEMDMVKEEYRIWLQGRV